MPRLKLTENQVKRQVTDYMTAHHYFWWTSKTMGVYDAARKCYRKDKNLMTGISDLAMLHKGTFYAIELKGVPGSPQSKEQKEC